MTRYSEGEIPMKSQETVYQQRVVVKFRDDLQIPYQDDIGGYIQNQGIGPWDALVNQFPGIRLDRLYTSLEPNEILELVTRAKNLDIKYNPPNFLTYFAIDVPPNVDADGLAKELAAWKSVEIAYVELEQAPGPAVSPNDEPITIDQPQNHLNSAPAGIGIRNIWDPALYPYLQGKDGAGIQFVDIEKGWDLNHEDLGGISFVLPGDNRAEYQHGTNSLGVVVARDNGTGVIGIAPAATAKVVSIYRDPTSTSPNRSDAILKASHSSVLAFGDILLLEIQVLDANNTDIRWPVEVERAPFDNIRLAIAAGIVVVEAAGTAKSNVAGAAQNLANYVVQELDTNSVLVRKNILDPNPGNIHFRDSGAIIVAGATSGTQHTRITTSNYGDRVNCYAWGEKVVTTDTDYYGNQHDAYSFNFSGTSSAAAIIAGTAIVVQSLAEQNLSYRFSPFQMRQILSNPDPAMSTLSANGSADGIGVMPNLEAIVTLTLGPSIA
jgi:serine protease